ncbi:SusD/RagB family nutrient-binding outer membrane lipoprotein [Mucilaginibacter auburnensis]|uniref:SusD-like starch-binding protein associating with outer membrane n=1 Tax=Mucilaginibacter auburnensis TaxID=1457233 RepID=A0A2H9VRR9_9SPHI|nr:SusD/RagB family nutrient-binding outer membrane lipoprotein [Mucilaginibacter auburnensis]PJJ83505.1 SusD-like starch-binding protein associating with outer membrane [Mucilaginibacter auburnensis]
MKKIFISVFTAAMLFSTSCKKDFFNINNNPNNPTEASITPKVLLPRILHTLGVRTGTGYDYAAQWTGYWAHSGTYGQSAEIESYQITAAFNATQWSNWYDLLFDVAILEKQGKALDQPFYVAVAKIIKAIGFMNLVDQYNNVPYSKAFDVSNNITPPYDKAEDIYNDLFVQLDQAAVLLKTTAATTDADIQAADIMFGTVSSATTNESVYWRKLANTMRLKLLVHMSQLPTTGAKAATVSAAITADGAGYLGAGENAAVNPGYVAVNLKQNPYWDTYKLSALGATDQYNRANTFILSKFAGPDGRLGANNNTTTRGQQQAATEGADDDYRYMFVFSKVQTPLTNPQAGFTNPKQEAPEFPNGPVYLYNYIGAQFGEVVVNTDPYKAPNQSDVAGPGLAKSVSQPQQVLTATESLFLQAEAASRGYIGGDATTLLTAAITESFNFLGVNKTSTGASTTPGAAATDYITKRNIAGQYAAATAGDGKAKVIVFEKWLSLIGLNHLEAYTDYRRLGVPADLPLSLNPARVNNVIPLRLQYPQNEFNYNATNVNAQGVINPQTSAVFWDK